MPLKRTPPTTPASGTTGTEIDTLKLPSISQNLSSSDPNLTLSSINAQRKRKRSNDFEPYMEDIKIMLNNNRDELRSAFEELRTSVDFLAQKYDLLLLRLEKLESDKKSDAAYIQALETKVDNFERMSRSTCLEIRNVPFESSESKVSLVNIFINTAKTLNVPVLKSDIKDIFRIKTKNPENRTIIVDLNSVLLKENIVYMYRKFNKSATKLSSTHLKIPGPAKQIYISENLTVKMRKLYYLAREFAKVNNFRYCWVSHGKIFLRKSENGQLIRVENESSLTNILA